MLDDMTHHLEAPFTIDKWEGSSIDTVEDGPELGQAELVKTYSGPELVGTATGHVVTTRGERGASYVAQERITGALDGRSGSFVLEHRASMGEGFPTVTEAQVVPGSGTGELANLSGGGLVEHGLLILDYDL
jgi:hypothetical protein